MQEPPTCSLKACCLPPLPLHAIWRLILALPTEHRSSRGCTLRPPLHLKAPSTSGGWHSTSCVSHLTILYPISQDKNAGKNAGQECRTACV